MARTERIIGQAMAGLAGPKITPLYMHANLTEIRLLIFHFYSLDFF